MTESEREEVSVLHDNDILVNNILNADIHTRLRASADRTFSATHAGVRGRRNWRTHTQHACSSCNRRRVVLTRLQKYGYSAVQVFLADERLVARWRLSIRRFD